jgi:hypothetical protein
MRGLAGEGAARVLVKRAWSRLPRKGEVDEGEKVRE